MSALGIDVLDTPAQAGPMTPPGYLAGALRLAFPSTLPREARFVLALDAYLDESGTNPDQAALSVAGYIASPDQLDDHRPVARI